MMNAIEHAELKPERMDTQASARRRLRLKLPLGQLGRNTLHMISGQLSVAIFQGIQFLLVARALGPYEFGRFAGVLAITAVLLPFSGLGAGNVMVLRLARNAGDARVYFGNALLVVMVSGLLLTLFALLWGKLFLGAATTAQLILVLAVSEIIFTKLVDIGVHTFYGLDKHAYSGFFYALQSFLRMLFAGALFLMPHPMASDWVWLHLFAGALAFVVALAMTIAHIGTPAFNVRLALQELKIGVFYSIGLSSKSVYTDIDKAVLARYVSPDIGGAYTAAFRLIFIAYTPIRAVLQASMARFFREGENGIHGPIRFATKIVMLGAVYCVFFAAVVYVGSPLICVVLGNAYALSAEVLRWLALVPLLLLFQDAYSDALMGANRQLVRSIFQVLTAVLCFCSNMILVQKFSWQGAVITTYCSQFLLGVMVISFVAWLMKRTKTATMPLTKCC